MQTQPKLRVDLDTREFDSDSRAMRTLRSAEEVESVREFWSSSPGTRDSDIDIFLSERRSGPEALRPHVLVLYRGGKPAVLMAGKIVRRELPFRVGWFTLFRPRIDAMMIPYGALRGEASSEDCKELVRGIIKCLENGEADIAYLEDVDADSALFCCAKNEPRFLFRDHFPRVRPHRKRKLPSTVEQLYTSLSTNQRSHFRYIAKKLAKDFNGQVRVTRFDDPADLGRTLAVVEEIAKRTWQRKLGRGFTMNAALLGALKTEAENGWLRVYTLYLADNPCAFWIGTIYQRTFFSDFVGYDPQYSRYSLGMYLLSQMMEEFCSHGVEEIDFGSSDEEYKKRFSNIVWRETNLHVFAPSPKGLALNAMNTITALLNEPTRAFLERTNLIQRAKKVWRKVNPVKEKPNKVQTLD